MSEIDELRIGWHYTPYDRWATIQKEGLIPQEGNTTKGLKKCRGLGEIPLGFSLFPKRQEDLSHVGCILYQCEDKNVTKVALLRVAYRLGDSYSHIYHQLSPLGYYVKLSHTGTLNYKDKSIVYHESQELVYIIRAIPASYIFLEGIYDIEDCLSYDNEQIKEFTKDLIIKLHLGKDHLSLDRNTREYSFI